MNPANFLHKEMRYFASEAFTLIKLLLIIISMSEYSVFLISLLSREILDIISY